MPQQLHYPLGQIDGAEVGVRNTLDGHGLLVEHSHRTEQQARLLASGERGIVWRDGGRC